MSKIEIKEERISAEEYIDFLKEPTWARNTQKNGLTKEYLSL